MESIIARAKIEEKPDSKVRNQIKKHADIFMAMISKNRYSNELLTKYCENRGYDIVNSNKGLAIKNGKLIKITFGLNKVYESDVKKVFYTPLDDERFGSKKEIEYISKTKESDGGDNKYIIKMKDIEKPERVRYENNVFKFDSYYISKEEISEMNQSIYAL